MVLRVQTERIHEPSLAAEEYILRYQLTPERLRLARPDALVLHPGPMIRGLEIDSAVADGPQSGVLEQVTNGLADAHGSALPSYRRRAGGRAPSRKGIDRMLLIKNGRVLDPATKTDAALDVLLDGERISKIGAESLRARRGNFRRQRLDRRARLHRSPLPSARAGPGNVRNHRDRHALGGSRRIHGRLLHAQYAAGERQRLGYARNRRTRRRRRQRARLADRRGLGGQQRRGAR